MPQQCRKPFGHIFNVIQQSVHLLALVLVVIVLVHGVQITTIVAHKCAIRKPATNVNTHDDLRRQKEIVFLFIYLDAD